MFFERIESPGLAHYSYLLGAGGVAIVIDPRRDCQVYVDRAWQEGLQIRHILETHRNEDYVIGSVELAARTGAKIWHADVQLPYRYGQPVEEGQSWALGGARLEAIHTPGHTPGSMSYLLHDPSGYPWLLFSGDALFAGDVGRVDLVAPERTEEMAGLLYDSLYGKLLPLGDQIIVCPGHGAGSVCGQDIAERAWTTIGLERLHSRKLQATSRQAFIERVAEIRERAPYFRMMERLNLEGAPLPGPAALPAPLSVDAFIEKMSGAQVLDTRDEDAFAGGHVPGALSIWEGGLSDFAGWFLSYDRPLLIVCDDGHVQGIHAALVRLGYDRQIGYLAGGMHDWYAEGQVSERIETISVQALCQSLDQGASSWILDVRTVDELEGGGRIAGAHHIPMAELGDQLGQVPVGQPVHVFCHSGHRATVAASLLQSVEGVQPVVVLGGLSAWSSTTCPLEACSP